MSFAPVEELVRVDPVLARHCGERIAGLLGFLQNRALFLGRPAPPALHRRDYFDGGHVGPVLGGSHTA